ncbi:MAG: ABC transporter ATP-binding protein, partial [Nitratireductor sp.]|nr:ABC transporter ATP-binding protein [Nitratireductor sp.]
MFRFFEKRINPYPVDEPGQPPDTLIAFCWHYSRPAMPWLIVMSVLTAMIAIIEVMMFGFLGNIVDWLSSANRESFLSDEAGRLAVMGGFLMIGLPLVVSLHSVVVHQVLLGNYPMIARWQMHRYLLRQSMQFFANEFAGRVATKIMQTSLAIREAVMKVMDIFVFVVTFFATMLFMVGSSDWRLAMPLVLWVVLYGMLIWWF